MWKINDVDNGVQFNVRVQPRASKNEIVGMYGEALKVRLTSPPVDGAANKVCITFFAKYFKVAKGQVEIVAGHKSRDKVIKIVGFSQQQVNNCLKSKGIVIDV